MRLRGAFPTQTLAGQYGVTDIGYDFAVPEPRACCWLVQARYCCGSAGTETEDKFPAKHPSGAEHADALHHGCFGSVLRRYDQVRDALLMRRDADREHAAHRTD